MSSETREECIKRGVSAETVHFIPNGFEPAPAAPTDQQAFAALIGRLNINTSNRSLIVSIGRPIKRKGFVWFVRNVLPLLKSEVVYIVVGPREKNIRFVALLSKVLPGAVFSRLSHLFGFGMEALELDRLMASPDFSDKVFFTGKLPQGELDQLLLHADLFVMPNLHVEGDYEGFGLVALEATTMGLVCVAARVDGIPSAVKDGLNGMLLPSESPEAWSQAIDRLLADEDELRQLGQQFKTNIENNMFNWQSMARAYFELFKAEGNTRP